MPCFSGQCLLRFNSRPNYLQAFILHIQLLKYVQFDAYQSRSKVSEICTFFFGSLLCYCNPILCYAIAEAL